MARLPDERAELVRARLGSADASRIAKEKLASAEEELSAIEKNTMTARCDCYVSLHRSEGYGLTMAEAMALGKPVIATDYSGNLDFMTPENSYLCSYTLRQIGPLRLGVRSRSVRGLYLAGASTNPGGGIPLVLASGRQAADAVLDDRSRVRRIRPGATARAPAPVCRPLAASQRAAS